MISICQPYSSEITCLCDEESEVLKCFLTSEAVMVQDMVGAGHNMDMNINTVPGLAGSAITRTNTATLNTVFCNKLVDTTTEILLCATIFVLILMLCTWVILRMRRKSEYFHCEACCQQNFKPSDISNVSKSEQTQSDELKSSNHIVSHELIGDHYAKNGIIQTYQDSTLKDGRGLNLHHLCSDKSRNSIETFLSEAV